MKVGGFRSRRPKPESRRRGRESPALARHPDDDLCIDQRAQLAADFRDVDLHHARLVRMLLSIEDRKQLGFADDCARYFRKRLQKRELGGAEMDSRAADLGRTIKGVEQKSADAYRPP